MVRLLLKRQRLCGRGKVNSSQFDEGKRAENGSGYTKSTGHFHILNQLETFLQLASPI